MLFWRGKAICVSFACIKKFFVYFVANRTNASEKPVCDNSQHRGKETHTCDKGFFLRWFYMS